MTLSKSSALIVAFWLWLARFDVLLIIGYCCLITADIWIERTLYHYTLEFLGVYAITMMVIINWILNLERLVNYGRLHPLW